jgi:hypothetical protein
VSRNELLEAYVAGDIGRRAFIEGLVGLGMTATTAASYAIALQPMTAEAARELFYLTHKKQCKNYETWGFKNRKQCVCYIKTGDPDEKCKKNKPRKNRKKGGR